MQQTTQTQRLNVRETNNIFVYKQSLSDSYSSDNLVANAKDKQVQIPCTITSSERDITISVEGYEDNMSVHFEYWNGKLQVFVWGEESLEREGDCDLKYVITDNYTDFCHRIGELYQD